MSQPEQVTNDDAVAELNEDDIAWLEERLVEYDEMLAYLREH